MQGRAIFGAALLTVCVAMVSPSGTSASASSRDGRFAVEEAGRARCSAFLRSKTADAPAFSLYVGFIEGYMTAANRYQPNTFDLTPWHNSASFALILEQHCRKNPNDALAMVAQELVVAMQPLRLADYSDLVEVTNGNTKARVYQTIMRRAQMELRRRGLYTGELDGKYSPTTRAALEQFQKSAKLEPNGMPDTATLWTLLNP